MASTLSPSQANSPWMQQQSHQSPMNNTPNFLTPSLSKPTSAIDNAVESFHPTIPSTYLKLFFRAHAYFVNKSIPLHLLSSQYLSLLKTCLDETLDDEQLDQHFKNEISQVYMMWLFVQYVYLSTAMDKTNHPTHYLSLWFQQIYPTAEIYNDAQLSEQLQNQEEDYDLWIEITKYIIYGDFDKCKQLLSEILRRKQLDNDEWRQITAAIHLGQYNQISNSISPFILLDAFLQACPSRNDQSNFIAWQQLIKRLFFINQEIQLSSHFLKSVFKIVIGDASEIESICTSWQQMLVPCAIYCTDSIDTGDDFLKHACGLASAAFEAPSDIAGGALIEASLGNLDQCIERLKKTMSTTWFSFHLLDLLVRYRKLSDVSYYELDEEGDGKDRIIKLDGEKYPLSKRQVYMMEFAESLILDKRYRSKCWRIILDYCPVSTINGNYFVSFLFSKLTFDNNSFDIIEKVLNLCERKRLKLTYSKICEVIGNQCTKKNEYGRAILYYSRIKNINKCEYITKLAIKDAERSGSVSISGRKLEGVACAIESCGDLQIRSTLQYAIVYCTMQDARTKLQTMYENENDDNNNQHNPQDEAENFVESIKFLIGYGGAERQFWSVIAYEAAKVVDVYPDIAKAFGRSVLLELLASLELISGPYTSMEMWEGLRVRITVDESIKSQHHHQHRQHIEKEHNIDLVPCELDVLQRKLDHCRSVLLQCLARRINES